MEFLPEGAPRAEVQLAPGTLPVEGSGPAAATGVRRSGRAPLEGDYSWKKNKSFQEDTRNSRHLVGTIKMVGRGGLHAFSKGPDTVSLGV